MKILILTGKFGNGHWSASLSLREELLRQDPAAQVEITDFFAYALEDGAEAVYKGFSLLVTHGSALYNLYYNLTQNARRESPDPLAALFSDKLSRLLEEARPDLVIATHPFCAQVIAAYKAGTGEELPLVTCVTDLSSHSEWVAPGTDGYLVGSALIREALAAKGVDRRRILVTGIPVRAAFKAPRRMTGTGRRHLLIMGGGLGLMPKSDSFYAALNALPDTDVTILTAATPGCSGGWRATGNTSRRWASPTGWPTTWPPPTCCSPSPAASPSSRPSSPNCPSWLGHLSSSRRSTMPNSWFRPASAPPPGRSRKPV